MTTKFEINPTLDDDVILTIWEDAEVSEDRIKPYLYKQNIRFNTKAEAEQFAQDSKDIYKGN